ncbi:RNA-directed RNA polymerase [ssRNA phage Gerhypos.3_2]|uniref:RNA-directed RNA polymerase n=2 Tax=Leviviricetes TaxID=2842243 RepID=A0A8S5L0J3_9VIRU|nr:RNA-directed RNA polymerase [ssRNA phage Gerhypos.3_2]QDH91066.1 MAG: RNA-dependent RNA polymerase [Leviviridae sp.]DAD51446.1 TPA_asm: RNA-directed RNA polymerase [ssRNA phage Gerhypos.3_2]
MISQEAEVFLGMFQSLQKDWLESYPSDTLEVERDYQRLSLAVLTRGLPTVLLDLPNLGKHFDRCLSDGAYVSSGLPLAKIRWKSSPIPRFLSGLMLRVFERDSGCLRHDVDVNAVLFLRQFYFFAKGYEYACTPDRTKAAVQEFYDVERELRSPTLNWAGDSIDLTDVRRLSFGDRPVFEDPTGDSRFESLQCSVDSPFLRTLEFVGDIVASSFGKFDSCEWSTKHGPGAVSDLGGKASKYCFPTWPIKLDTVFPFSHHAFLNYADWAENHDQPCSEQEATSKLLTVPKTFKGPRLIASEPVAHQWCQQALLRYFLHGIEHSALRHSISLRDQEPSRRMVLDASLDREYATIDLSAASDRVSCWIIERFFRANKSLLEALFASRTRYIRNGTKAKVDAPEKLLLKKFSTMGSACTFPVQSIVFSAICIATIIREENWCLTARNVRRAARAVRVFGDDIIIPTAHFDAVSRNLGYIGLKVNDAKSFAKGNFRESCGMDAWGGFDVTPGHLNRIPDRLSPASFRSVVDASNNFFRKGFWHTASFLSSTLPRWFQKELPKVSTGCGVFGLESYCGGDISSLRRRVNADLQREEVRVPRLKSRAIRAEQTGRHDLFQYFTESPGPDKWGVIAPWEPGRVRESSVYLTLGWEPISIFNR